MEPELTVLEAARILGVHPESVKRWIRYGELQATKHGILYYIKRSDLESFQLLREAAHELRKTDPRAFWSTPQGEFIAKVGEQLDGIVADQPLCILALEPGGVCFAELLARYRAVKKGQQPAILSLNVLDPPVLEDQLRAARELLRGRKLLIVDDESYHSEPYRTVTNLCFRLAGLLGFEDFFLRELDEYFEIIIAPFLSGQVEDFDPVKTAKRIPLAVHTDHVAIASFFVRRPPKE
jgi:excisionase family DNA binding protein